MDILRTMINQDSLKELENMSQRLNGVLRGRSAPREDREEAMALADWVPMVDVAETDTEFLLRAELPGVEKKNVKLSIERGVLTLTGQRAGQGKQGHPVPSGRTSIWEIRPKLYDARVGGRTETHSGISQRRPDGASAEVGKGQTEIH